MRFPLILAAAPLAIFAALPSCTPAARREAAAVVSTVAPALCSTPRHAQGPLDWLAIALFVAVVAAIITGLAR